MTDNRFIQDGGEQIVQRTVQVPVERVVREEVNPVIAQAEEPVSHWSKWWWLPLLLLALIGALLWHGCHTATTYRQNAVTQTIHTTLTETVHREVTEAAPAETVTVAPENLTLTADEENTLRDGIHGIVPDIERDGEDLLNGAKHLCAAILGGTGHAAADIAGWFHLASLEEGAATEITNLVTNSTWCHH